eukprot:1930966-Rhodomonas_salina.5
MSAHVMPLHAGSLAGSVPGRARSVPGRISTVQCRFGALLQRPEAYQAAEAPAGAEARGLLEGEEQVAVFEARVVSPLLVAVVGARR